MDRQIVATTLLGMLGFIMLVLGMLIENERGGTILKYAGIISLIIPALVLFKTVILG